MRVALLPTGRMEWAALRIALARLFPAHEFYSIPTEAEVVSYESIDFPAQSFTSCDVRRILGRPNNADKLIQRAVGEALSDRTRSGADLVVVIDDMEVANRAQAGAVTSVVREAVERHLASLSHRAGLRATHAAALRDRVSFHVAKPMIESWLFPDPRALRLAGVPVARRPVTMEGADPENFQTVDTAYDGDTGAACTCWHALPSRTPAQTEKKRKSRPQWLKAGPDRQLHPKAYLAWLCSDPSEPTCSCYAESRGGASALGAVDWAALFRDPTHAPFARALIHDIADALGEPEPFPGLVAPETARTRLPPTPLLRNL